MADRPYTLLLTEATAESGAPLARVLEAQGWQVRRVSDPADVLLGAASPDVDLVLVPLEGGEVDGLDLLRALRDQLARRATPLVALGGDTQARRVAALKGGAEDVLVPPLDPEELVARLSLRLAAKRRVDALVAQAGELERLSVTDGLTAVFNHRFFQERLREEFRRAQRYDDPLALIVVDVDHFKRVNDTFGHQMGDVVLREVAAALKRNVRETDIVARYGGEEFAVLLPKTPLAGALTVAERIWRDLGALQLGEGGALRITASLGLSSIPHRQVTHPDALFRTADEALYRAKHTGRNRICLHQPLTLAGDPGEQAG